MNHYLMLLCAVVVLGASPDVLAFQRCEEGVELQILTRESVTVAPQTSTLCGIDVYELVRIERGERFLATTHAGLGFAPDDHRVIDFVEPAPQARDAEHRPQPYDSLVGRRFLLWDSMGYLTAPPLMLVEFDSTSVDMAHVVTTSSPLVVLQEYTGLSEPVPTVATKTSNGCVELSRPLAEPGEWMDTTSRRSVYVASEADTVTAAPRLRVDESRAPYLCSDYGLYVFVPVDANDGGHIYEWTVTDASGQVVESKFGPEPLLFGSQHDSIFSPGHSYQVEIRVQNADGSLSEPATFTVPFEFNHPWTLGLTCVLVTGLLVVFMALVALALVRSAVLAVRNRIAG